MPLILRKGDTASHGGKVISGASKSFCEGKAIARKGDIYACPIHGNNPIVGHSNKLKCEGKWVARHGDLTACGATLISGAVKSYDE